MLFSFLDINKATTYLCLSFTDYSGVFSRRFGKEQDLLPSLFVSNQLCIIVKKKVQYCIFVSVSYFELSLMWSVASPRNIIYSGNWLFCDVCDTTAPCVVIVLQTCNVQRPRFSQLLLNHLRPLLFFSQQRLGWARLDLESFSHCLGSLCCLTRDSWQWVM